MPRPGGRNRSAALSERVSAERAIVVPDREPTQSHRAERRPPPLYPFGRTRTSRLDRRRSPCQLWEFDAWEERERASGPSVSIGKGTYFPALALEGCSSTFSRAGQIRPLSHLSARLWPGGREPILRDGLCAPGREVARVGRRWRSGPACRRRLGSPEVRSADQTAARSSPRENLSAVSTMRSDV